MPIKPNTKNQNPTGAARPRAGNTEYLQLWDLAAELLPQHGNDQLKAYRAAAAARPDLVTAAVRADGSRLVSETMPSAKTGNTIPKADQSALSKACDALAARAKSTK